MFGPEDEFFNRFAAMARISPLLPLIGGGRTRFQPVFVGDVAAAIAAVAAGAGKPGTVYELGGPEVLTFRELLDLTQEWADRSRGYLPMPFWLAKLQALLTWPLPNSLRPVTLDQVRMLQHDNIVSAAAKSEGRTLAGLGVDAPHGVAAIVPTYLERFRARGQFASYRTVGLKQKGSGRMPEPRNACTGSRRQCRPQWTLAISRSSSMAWPIAACRVSVSAKGVPSAACSENRSMPFGNPSMAGNMRLASSAVSVLM